MCKTKTKPYIPVTDIPTIRPCETGKDLFPVPVTYLIPPCTDFIPSQFRLYLYTKETKVSQPPTSETGPYPGPPLRPRVRSWFPR